MKSYKNKSALSCMLSTDHANRSADVASPVEASGGFEEVFAFAEAFAFVAVVDLVSDPSALSSSHSQFYC